MTADHAFRHLLKSVGAVLVRSGHHRVYKLPSGRTFVCANSCSDKRGYKNAVSILRRILAEDGISLPRR